MNGKNGTGPRATLGDDDATPEGYHAAARVAARAISDLAGRVETLAVDLRTLGGALPSLRTDSLRTVLAHLEDLARDVGFAGHDTARELHGIRESLNKGGPE